MIQIKVKAIARISVTLLLFKSIKYVFKVVSTLQSFQTVKKQIIHILVHGISVICLVILNVAGINNEE